MFLSASNGAAQQMALEIARLEKIKQRKKEAQRLRQQHLESQEEFSVLSSSSHFDSCSKSVVSKGSKMSSASGDKKKKRGMLGFLKKGNMGFSKRDLGAAPSAEFDKSSTNGSVGPGSSAVKSSSGPAVASGKATVMTEATQEVSVRSSISKDPPSSSHGPESARPEADVELSNNNSGRRQRRTVPGSRSSDVPKFLHSDQDGGSTGGGKKSSSGQRSVASSDDDYLLGLNPSTSDLSTPKQMPKKKASGEAAKDTGVPFVIQVDGDDDEGEEEDQVPDMPDSPKKKSILKASKPEDLAVRTVPTVPLSPGGGPIDVNDTIFIRHNGVEDDVITCITMEDFKDLAKKPKRRPKRIAKKNLSTSSKGSKGKGSGSRSSGGNDNSSRGSRDSCGTLSDSRLAEILRKDVRSKNATTLIAGLRSICDTAAKSSKHRSKIVHFGALPSILQVIEANQVKSTDVVMAALIAIQKIAGKDPKHQQAVCELGGIPTIAAAMQVNMVKPDILGAACKTLELITTCMRLPEDHDDEEDEDDYEDVPTKGAITVLSCCLMAHPKDKDILAYSFCTLINLCMNRPHMLQSLSDAGGVALMSAALEQKWKSKSRKNQALEDLPIILESVDDASEESEESSSSSSEEEDSDDDSSDEE